MARISGNGIVRRAHRGRRGGISEKSLCCAWNLDGMTLSRHFLRAGPQAGWRGCISRQVAVVGGRTVGDEQQHGCISANKALLRRQ